MTRPMHLRGLPSRRWTGRVLPEISDETRARFESKVKRGPSCWEWVGYVGNCGYGRFTIKDKSYVASRLAYHIYCGPLPSEMDVLHTCDNPVCVSPFHLRLGTHAENMAEKRLRGRARSLCGSARPDAKITERDVVVIRSLAESNVAIAKRFGISPVTVSKIRRRVAWRHVA